MPSSEQVMPAGRPVTVKAYGPGLMSTKSAHGSMRLPGATLLGSMANWVI